MQNFRDYLETKRIVKFDLHVCWNAVKYWPVSNCQEP